ncbi:MAG: metalloregulator ArsR/SmtB family transcription factor [Vicinamibacterales bacterium]
MDVDEASGLMRLLGDEVRLRLLRALSTEALNVSELTVVLGIAQSGVSRHLGLLRKAALVIEERTGGYTWYRLAPQSAESGSARAPLWEWLRVEFARGSQSTRADDARLQEVLRVRKEGFVEHGAGAQRGQLVPGRSWAAWSRALGLLLPSIDVADLGCGEGYLTMETARWARRVTAVDRSKAVLDRARGMAHRRKLRNIVWKRGELERLPLRPEAVDVALLSQALHHAADPAAALGEAYRVLRDAGRVLVLDLRAHDESWVRSTLGDRWLGFSEARLRELLTGAGFRDVTVRIGARTPADPFVVLIAVGTKLSGRANSQKKRTTA